MIRLAFEYSSNARPAQSLRTGRRNVDPIVGKHLRDLLIRGDYDRLTAARDPDLKAFIPRLESDFIFEQFAMELLFKPAGVSRLRNGCAVWPRNVPDPAGTRLANISPTR